MSSSRYGCDCCSICVVSRGHPKLLAGNVLQHLNQTDIELQTQPVEHVQISPTQTGCLTPPALRDHLMPLRANLKPTGPSTISAILEASSR